MNSRDPSNYVFWLTSRAAGITAFILIATAVVLGLYMAGNLGTRPGYKRVLVKLHEHIAIAALIAIPVHGFLLLGDRWLNPGISGVLVPFTMAYRPLWTGLGITAGYLAVLLGLTFYARRRFRPGLWRRAHRFIVLVYVLGAAHALGGGSDGGGIWLRGIVVLSATPILVLLVLRYRPKPQRSAARRPQTEGTP